VIFERVSTPATSTVSAAPARIWFRPSESAYRNPEQAAEMSKAYAEVAPSLSCKRHAVEGKGRSPVTVPTMI
jgi:hypothetical protein